MTVLRKAGGRSPRRAGDGGQRSVLRSDRGAARGSALWFATAYSENGGEGTCWVSGDLGWFIGATAAVALMVTAVVPGALDLTDRLGSGLQVCRTPSVGPWGTAGGGFTMETALWVGFSSLLAGAALAAVGGLLGGKLRRPVVDAGRRSRDTAADSTDAVPPRPSR